MSFFDSMMDLTQPKQVSKRCCFLCGSITDHIELDRRDMVRLISQKAEVEGLEKALEGSPFSPKTDINSLYAAAAIHDLNPISKALAGRLLICSLCKYLSVQDKVLPPANVKRKAYQLHLLNLCDFEISLCVHYWTEGKWHTTKIGHLQSNQGGIVIPELSDNPLTGYYFYIHASMMNGRIFQGADESEETPRRYHETVEGEEREFSLVTMQRKFCVHLLKLRNYNFR